MKTLICIVSFALDFGFSSGKARAETQSEIGFSAEHIRLDASIEKNESAERVYVSPSGIRIENDNTQGLGHIVIINFARMVKLWLLPEHKRYLETPLDEEDIEVGHGLFAGTPCQNYEKAGRLGTEILQGRTTEKWRCENPKRSADTLFLIQWFDPALSFVIRQESDRGAGFELRNILESQQAAELFNVPVEYTKIKKPSELFHD